MGLKRLFRNYFGKRSNKVGVISVEETEAYNKLEEERKIELVEDEFKNPLPWMMFQVGVKDHANDRHSVVEVVGHKMTGLLHKKGGMAFSIECLSKACKLPPLSISEERKKRLKEKGRVSKRQSYTGNEIAGKPK